MSTPPSTTSSKAGAISDAAGAAAALVTADAAALKSIESIISGPGISTPPQNHQNGQARKAPKPADDELDDDDAPPPPDNGDDTDDEDEDQDGIDDTGDDADDDVEADDEDQDDAQDDADEPPKGTNDAGEARRNLIRQAEAVGLDPQDVKDILKAGGLERATAFVERQRERYLRTLDADRTDAGEAAGTPARGRAGSPRADAPAGNRSGAGAAPGATPGAGVEGFATIEAGLPSEEELAELEQVSPSMAKLARAVRAFVPVVKQTVEAREAEAARQEMTLAQQIERDLDQLAAHFGTTNIYGQAFGTHGVGSGTNADKARSTLLARAGAEFRKSNGSSIADFRRALVRVHTLAHPDAKPQAGTKTAAKGGNAGKGGTPGPGAGREIKDTPENRLRITRRAEAVDVPPDRGGGNRKGPATTIEDADARAEADIERILSGKSAAGARGSGGGGSSNRRK